MHHIGPMFLEDVDIEKVLVSDKIVSCETSCKYFVGHLYDDYKVKHLLIMLLKTSNYVKSYDGQNTMTTY